jgi:hypothetical protein
MTMLSAVLLPGLLNAAEVDALTERALADAFGPRRFHNRPDDPLMGILHESIQPTVEAALGVPMTPVTCFFRVYEARSIMATHTDFAPCDVTVSVGVASRLPEGYDGWPLIVDGEPLVLPPGAGVAFAGLPHGRDPFDVPDGCYQVQALFFYSLSESG